MLDKKGWHIAIFLTGTHWLTYSFLRTSTRLNKRWCFWEVFFTNTFCHPILLQDQPIVEQSLRECGSGKLPMLDWFWCPPHYIGNFWLKKILESRKGQNSFTYQRPFPLLNRSHGLSGPTNVSMCVSEQREFMYFSLEKKTHPFHPKKSNKNSTNSTSVVFLHSQLSSNLGFAFGFGNSIPPRFNRHLPLHRSVVGFCCSDLLANGPAEGQVP